MTGSEAAACMLVAQAEVTIEAMRAQAASRSLVPLKTASTTGSEAAARMLVAQAEVTMETARAQAASRS